MIALKEKLWKWQGSKEQHSKLTHVNAKVGIKHEQQCAFDFAANRIVVTIKIVLIKAIKEKEWSKICSGGLPKRM